MVHILLVSVSSIEGFDMLFVSGLNLTLNNALITWYDQVAVSSGVGVPQKKKKCCSLSVLVLPGSKSSLMAVSGNSYVERY